MRTVAVICARKGSWDKCAEVLAPRCVAPVEYAIATCRDAGIADIIVSTDSPEVADLARTWRTALHHRPRFISGPTARIEDAVRHAVKDVDCHAVIVIQGNMPVWRPGDLGSIRDELAFNPFLTAVATAFKVDHRPEWMKVKNGDDIAKPFMPSTKAYRRQDLPNLYYLDGQAVIVRKEVLMAKPKSDKPHAWMGDKVGMVIHPWYCGFEIHDREDLEVAATLRRLV